MSNLSTLLHLLERILRRYWRKELITPTLREGGRGKEWGGAPLGGKGSTSASLRARRITVSSTSRQSIESLRVSQKCTTKIINYDRGSGKDVKKVQRDELLQRGLEPCKPTSSTNFVEREHCAFVEGSRSRLDEWIEELLLPQTPPILLPPLVPLIHQKETLFEAIQGH